VKPLPRLLRTRPARRLIVASGSKRLIGRLHPSKTATSATKPAQPAQPAQPNKSTTPAKPGAPAPKPKLRLVAKNGRTIPERRKTGMAAIDAVIEQVQQQLAGFRPQSRSEADAFFKALPDLFTELGSALHAAASGMEEDPIQAPVVEALHELASAAGGLHDPAETVAATHSKQHDMWLTD
jgi:hypothetical protein